MPSSTTGSSVAGLASATNDSPFGTPLDPYQLKGSVLATPYNVIQATSYLLADKIFSFTSPAKDASAEAPRTDNLLKLWSDLKRKNLSGSVPELYSLDITPGCGELLNGFLSKNGGEPVTVFGSSGALRFLVPSLKSLRPSANLSLQVSTLDYNFDEGRLQSNFAQCLADARQLRLPVLVSTTPKQAQHYAALSAVLAQLGVANIHLFDGLETYRTSELIQGVLSSQELQGIRDLLLPRISKELDDKKSTEKVSFALKQLNAILSTHYAPFQYFGSKFASTVFVVAGTDSLAVSLLSQIDKFSVDAATVIVSSPLPFDIAAFKEILPEATKKVVVVSQELGDVSPFKLDVQAALFMNGDFTTDVVAESTETFTPAEFQRLLDTYAGKAKAFLSSTGSTFRFLLDDDSVWADVPGKITFGLSLVPDLSVQYRPKYDNAVNAGVFNVDIHAGKDLTGKYNLVIAESQDLLNKVDLISTLKENGTLLVINPGDKKFDADKYVEKLALPVKKLLAETKTTLKVLDLNAIGEDPATKGRTAQFAIQVAFWTIAYPDLEISAVVNKIWNTYGSEAELLASVIANLADKVLKEGFHEIPAKAEWATEEPAEEDEEITALATELVDSSFSSNPRAKFAPEEGVVVKPQFTLAKELMFKEAYGTSTSLRPDEPVKNFVIKVKENKRVTPADYPRNIFQIEFDLGTTGLKYSIGEALGIHARNNVDTVEAFIKMYGLEPKDIVEVASTEDPTILEERTVEQSLIENIDLLGKPSKNFYDTLSEYAADATEKKALKKLASPAGAAQLKEYQEEYNYNFADVLELFPSARPDAQSLLEMIPPLKRREYSIASSQALHPDEVHLLIVVVDWKDKLGRQRYGQCSKYLSDLKVGDEVVVSVKPSLMKLPPTTKQPIIMAGLGTGLAPFKAFIEERQFQFENGEEIGEIYLYLGSRHKKEEYLYGEYWEAYMDADILTHLGAAFSRDQPNKIYIQDKIRENLDELTDLICNKGGHFYLCGPTWPVPDITACLEDVYTNDAKNRGEEIDAAEAVEIMKEDGKYVLEVY